MNELIERLERATGPNFSLEQDIWCEIYAPDAVAIPLDLKPPSYTASIDAALALVPEGSFWSASHGRVRSGEPLGAARIYTPLRELVAEAEAQSVPLAICIAALKARGVPQQGTQPTKSK